MTLNRQQRRMLQRSGDVDGEGNPVAQRRQPPAAPRAEERTGALQFIREVRQELKKVAWPSRETTIKYSIVVLANVVVLTAMMAGLDWVFSEFVIRLFST
jgi:preprotein translocase subunit SecE